LKDKPYAYVGPKEIAARLVGHSTGVRIRSFADWLAWIRTTKQQPGSDGLFAATFVIDAVGDLLLADRHSEHVACAGGGAVLSAGELFFRVNGETIAAVAVSNQSTGFCPEPESWPAVATAFEQIGVRHPGRFTTEIVFRRCESCRQRNIVKDGWFVCAVCEAELPARWNFSE